MKRLLVVLALVILPTTLFAQAADRDVLVTPDGTLYTIESVPSNSSAGEIHLVLRLTVQHVGEAAQSIIVPDSQTPGSHTHASLAFDSSSGTLFVFWLKMLNPTCSELLLTSFQGGLWQPAVSVGSHVWRVESNLRIQTSHRTADTPLLVHAVWWEDSGDSEGARYGLFVIEKGVVSTIYLDDLTNFLYVDENGQPNVQGPTSFPVDANFTKEILRHPALVDNGTSDSIDVLFGDVPTNSLNRVTLKPVIQGRIHIPIGFKPGPHVPAPRRFSEQWTGSIDTIVSSRDGSMLLYNATKDAVSYIVYTDGAWSSVKSVPLSDKLSADAAVAALSRMMNQ